MIEIINENLILVLALVPVVTGIVEIMKQAGMYKGYAGIASVLAGVALSILLLGSGQLPEALVAGIILGLAASGLWDNGQQLRGRTRA